MPDTVWKYSNSDFPLLGKVVEVVSHERYDLTKLDQAPPSAVPNEATPTLPPSTEPSTNTPVAQPSLQTPSQRYAQSVAAMRKLDIPPFVTYRTDWNSTGLAFMFAQDDKRIVLDVGTGHGFKKQHAYAVAYRNADRVLDVTEAESVRLVGPGTHVLDPTWTGAYDTLRYGLHGEPPPGVPGPTPPPGAAAPTPSPGPTASDVGPAPRTIGVVSAIAASFYRVEDAGSGTCADGSAARILKLTALQDAKTHPLTQVAIDTSNDLFCSMRFTIDENGVAGVTGNYEIHFAQSGAYWLVQGGGIDVAVRFLGIAARHVTLHWENSNFSTPTDLPATTFAPPSPN